jgi:hypothetical protein
MSGTKHGPEWTSAVEYAIEYAIEYATCTDGARSETLTLAALRCKKGTMAIHGFGGNLPLETTSLQKLYKPDIMKSPI